MDARAKAISESARANGRQGGLASRGKTSQRKAVSSRANGKKGGRPTFWSQGKLTAAERRRRLLSGAWWQCSGCGSLFASDPTDPPAEPGALCDSCYTLGTRQEAMGTSKQGLD